METILRQAIMKNNLRDIDANAFIWKDHYWKKKLKVIFLKILALIIDD